MSYAALREQLERARERSERWLAAKARLYHLAEAAGIKPPPNVRMDYGYQCWPIYDPRKGYDTQVAVYQDGVNPDLWEIRTGDFGRREARTPEEVVAILLAGLPTNDPEQVSLWNGGGEQTQGANG
jgi:hypothetical protein